MPCSINCTCMVCFQCGSSCVYSDDVTGHMICCILSICRLSLWNEFFYGHSLTLFLKKFCYINCTCMVSPQDGSVCDDPEVRRVDFFPEASSHKLDLSGVSPKGLPNQY